MIKVYQKRWFDVKFNEFYQLTPQSIAKTDFYKQYYDNFYKTYSSWDHLPISYIEGRREVATHLANRIKEKNVQTALTLGCGNGIIEKELQTLAPYTTILAYEPDETNLTWLRKLTNVKLYFGQFPACLPTNQSYDLVYLCDVDCVFADEEYISILTTIKQITSAPILLTNVIKPLPTLFARIKYWGKYVLAKLGLYQLGQLLGYSRYIHEHQAIFNRAGYTIVDKGDLNQDLMWIEIRPR